MWSVSDVESTVELLVFCDVVEEGFSILRGPWGL